MKPESVQIYSTRLHIFDFINHPSILFNQLYPTMLQRNAPAIIIIGKHKPICIYSKNLNRELQIIFKEYGNTEVFFRFINPLKIEKFRYLFGDKLTYRRCL